MAGPARPDPETQELRAKQAKREAEELRQAAGRGHRRGGGRARPPRGQGGLPEGEAGGAGGRPNGRPARTSGPAGGRSAARWWRRSSPSTGRCPRIESTPVSSPPSTTTRWRKPPRTIASAARSSDHSGEAKVRSDGEVGGHLLGVGVLPRRDRLEHVALREDSRPRLLGVDHHGGAHVALRHQAGRRAQRMTGIDRENDPRHAVLNLHFRPPRFLVTIGSNYRTVHPIAPFAA